ncbi:MAG: hypothetical protein KGH98_04435 [Candidatus Micrarchaeota archaeon]|nr:hypothetical protein [Candidatus Micrarchaeota archaeon]
MQKLSGSSDIRAELYRLVQHLRTASESRCVVLGEEAKRVHSFGHTYDFGVELALAPRETGVLSKVLSINGYDYQDFKDSVLVRASGFPIRVMSRKEVYGIPIGDLQCNSVKMDVPLGSGGSGRYSADFANPLHLAIMEYYRMKSNPFFESTATGFILNYIGKAQLGTDYMEKGRAFVKSNELALKRYLKGEFEGFTGMVLGHFSP